MVQFHILELISLDQVTLPCHNPANICPIYMKQKTITKFGKFSNVQYIMGMVAPLVHAEKLTYLLPFIKIAHHALLQVIFSWMIKQL